MRALLGLLERLDTRRTNVVRVLSYGSLCASDALERQLEQLARACPVVSAAQVVDALEGGRPLPPRSVLLCFGEARGFAELAWPLLRRFGFPAVLFVAPLPGETGAPAELAALAAQGLTLGVRVEGAARSERGAALPAEVTRWLAALERVQVDAPRVLAHRHERPSDEELAAARAAGVELAITRLPGANDLRWVDPLRLRGIPLEASAPLDVLQACLAQRIPRWRRRGRWVAPATPEERRASHLARARRRRMRLVVRPLDALLTGGLRPRPTLLAALRGCVRLRSSNYERLRSLVGLIARGVPPFEGWSQRALLARTRLPLAVEGLVLVGHGSAATVFRLEPGRGRPPLALKVYRWTVGEPALLAQQTARRQRARYRQLRRWFGDCVLTTHFLLLHGPLRGFPAAAALQPLIERSSDLLARTDGELLDLLRSRAELAAEFAVFARRLRAVRALGFAPDLLGAGNLLLVEHGASAQIRLIDCDGLYDLRCRLPGVPRERLDAIARRFQALLDALVPAEPGASDSADPSQT